MTLKTTQQQEEADYLSPEDSSSSPIIILNNMNHNNSSPVTAEEGEGNGTTVRKEKTPRYGWCSLTPSCIQFLVNRKAFLFIFCMTCVLQGTFHTYFVAVITTLEKLFSIPSQVTGTLMMGSEIGQMSSALLLPYFVGQGHRPRWMAIGSSLFSFATLLCASPHVLIPLSLKLKTTQESQYCGEEASTSTLPTLFSTTTNDILFSSSNSNNETSSLSCTNVPVEQDNPHFILFPIIFLSLFTIGMGQTAVYTLGIPFLDDNVASKDSPIYFSITIGVRILGPVLGFILGSLCTRLYIYPHITPEYDPTDPRWLGAWWLGMLLISGSLFLTSIIMYGFPATLKRGKAKAGTVAAAQAQQQQQRLQESDQLQKQSSSSSPEHHKQPKLRYFPKTLKRLLTNKILILRTFSSVFHLLPISGLYTFLPKYLESQFRLAAFQANMVTGIAGILVMGIGIFSSGVFIRRREPSARGIAVWVAGAAGIYSMGMVALMFVGCGASGGNPAGEVLSGGSISDFRIQEGNNYSIPFCDVQSKCDKCSESVYSPVCGSDNFVYFSPCHAGCSQNDAIVKRVEEDGKMKNKTIYTNCTCVVPNDDIKLESDGRTATSGMCPVSCDLFPLYLTIFMIIVLVHSTCEVGSMLLTLRCVEPRDKAMALGLIQCAIGIFGNVPCPVIYGTVVDSACIVWGMTSGSPGGTGDCPGSEPFEAIAPKRGHCWVYDSSSFRVYFHGTTAFLMFIAFLIDIVVVFHANRINIGTSEDENNAVAGANGANNLDRGEKIQNGESSSSPPTTTTLPDINSKQQQQQSNNKNEHKQQEEEASPLLNNKNLINGGNSQLVDKNSIS